MKLALLFSLSTQLLLLLLLSTTTTTTTLAALAESPEPAGPTNITRILEKAGQYTVLLHLLKTTQIGDQINTQLNNSDQGLTVFAPTDNAFATLKPGTLNALTDEQKVELIQFHIIPSFLSTSQFQTVSNPLRTQAGNSGSGEFPLNITTAGTQVNVSTGIVDTTVTNNIYSDNNLAVYEVDKVLLPLELFGTPAPAGAPALAPSPLVPKKKKSFPEITASDGPGSSSTETAPESNSSGDVGLTMHGMVLSILLAVFAASCL